MTKMLIAMRKDERNGGNYHLNPARMRLFRLPGGMGAAIGHPDLVAAANAATETTGTAATDLATATT